MKNYIFLIPSICNIGGAILYLLNKIRYLERNNWNVDVYYARKDTILVKELEKYSSNCYPCLDYSIMYFRKSFVKKYTDIICDNIKKNVQGEIIIESSTVSLATWGELVASKLNCKHVCFAFEELFELSNSQRDFLYFKHKRHELAGITDKSVPMMFEGYDDYKIESPEYYSARTVPTIMDVPHEYIEEVKKFDIVIGSMGRLDKGFVWPALKEIEKYINTHKGRKYAIVLIGDTKDVVLKNKIANLFEGKAKLFITGEIWPVPRQLVSNVDVFVSSSGSAGVTAIDNIPTIVVSPATYLPNGILNYTTREILFQDKPSEKSISELIEEIIDNNFCNSYPCLNMFDGYWEQKEKDDEAEFDRQIEIAEKREYGYHYYDVFKIKNKGKRAIVSLYGKTVGAKCFITTFSFLRKKASLIKG